MYGLCLGPMLKYTSYTALQLSIRVQSGLKEQFLRKTVCG